jgi:glycerol-3-phosphate dehydrogenase
MFLYDFLSSFQNTPFKIKSAKEVSAEIPELKTTGLSGAGVYYDGVMDDAKITLEVIYDALKEDCAEALTHTEVITVKRLDEKNIIDCKNLINGEFFQISCDQVVYALGPFTDLFLKSIPMYNWKDVLLPSKGSHLWIKTKDLPIKYPIVMTTNDNRVIFVVPHGDQVLVGTTEVAITGDYFDVKASDSEINYLLSALNNYFPKLNLTHSHILSTFAGIRPLVCEGNNNLGKTSREHKIFQPMSNTYVIAGGKYTTFRVMGQQITREICHKFNKSYNENLTKQPLRKKSVVSPFDWKVPTSKELIQICEEELPKTFEDLVVRRLSISSREIWNSRSSQQEFNQYFLSHLEELKKYLVISEESILNFK